jgi:S-adenosylmethionine hydrolase
MLMQENSGRAGKGHAGRIITLLTDFGLRDVYAGILKGVIIGIAPSVAIVDLTHEIPPQDVRAASFCLAMAYPFFPKGTIHLAVVDPGVGTQRRAVAVAMDDSVLVGPDNGIFSGVFQKGGVQRAVALTRAEFWLTENPGCTFHGRDIFAPAAAYLASGVPLARLGEAVDPATLVRLDPAGWSEDGDGFSGCIQYVDTFGNLVTDIPGRLVEGKQWKIQAAGQEIPGGKTYGGVSPGALLGLVGSHGFVEIAENGGSARISLAMKLGDPVRLVYDDVR